MNLNKNFRSITPGYLNTITVVDHDLSFALRLLKTNGKSTIKELNERKSYVKPSKQRREQLNSAKFKQNKDSNETKKILA